MLRRVGRHRAFQGVLKLLLAGPLSSLLSFGIFHVAQSQRLLLWPLASRYRSVNVPQAPAGTATSAARSSADARGINRLSDRSFDFSAISFTSLLFAAIHRTAAVAKKCEQIKREIRPLITLRSDEGRYGPFPRGSAQGCGGL